MPDRFLLVLGVYRKLRAKGSSKYRGAFARYFLLVGITLAVIHMCARKSVDPISGMIGSLFFDRWDYARCGTCARAQKC